MKLGKKIGLVLTLLAMIIASTMAQTYNFIHYDAENGLSQSQVKTIDEDKNGMLWIGTLAGLTCFDGKKFTVYTKNDGLAENWITASNVDKNGNLWLGHWGGNLTKVNIKEHNFEIVNLAQYSGFRTVSAIKEDKYGNLWVGTNGSGLFKYEIATSKVYSITATGKLSSQNISSIEIDNFGEIWIGTDNGVIIYNPKLPINSAKAYVYINEQNGLASNNVTCIAKVFKNDIWIGSEASGITMVKVNKEITANNIDLKADGLIKYLKTEDGLSSNIIQDIKQDIEWKVWIGTKGGGVNVFIPSSKKNDHDFYNGRIQIFTTRQGLTYNSVNKITRTRDGSYWIGTDLGLNQYFGDRFMIYDEKDNLVNNLVWSVIEDNDKNLWFGTNNGISKFSFTTQLNSNLTTNYQAKNYTTADGLPNNIILSVFQDNENTIWIGTSAGIAKIKKGETKFTAVKSNQDLANATIYAINSDKNNNIWFGTKNGAYKFNPIDGSYVKYDSKNGLGGNSVFRIYRDKKFNLWFAFLGGYLTRFDGREFKVFDKSDGIDNKLALCISEDNEDHLWVGTYGNGLFKYDGKKFLNISTKEGLSSDAPHSIQCDKWGNLWIGTRQGVDKYNIKEKSFTHYSKQEGFLGIETNGNAICKDYQGNIWFGTIMGATRVNASYNQNNNVAPNVLINELSIRHRNAPFPIDGKFSYSDNYLTFRFIGVSLTQPEKVRYKYKLEGFDEEWSPITNKNEAIYSNLPAGNYTLKVLACNNDGFWCQKAVEYKFSVTPPFWKTIWFYLLVFIAIFVSIYSFIRIREKNLVKEKEHLENQVSIRTIEIQSQKEVIEQSNKVLSYKNNQIHDSLDYAQRIQEAILTPINLLKHYLPNSFIFYKPKDIVSGDFYWVYVDGDNILFAAVDCTGHGVPGAFMSIIGFNLLEKVVKEHGKTRPSDILNELGPLIITSLRQEDKDIEVKDGLEIALCSLNLKTNLISYAGTKHPLIIIRNGEIIEVKGNHISIGSDIMEKGFSYDNHELQLEKNDGVYIFSDGYSDQRGGPKNKKFMIRNFKEFLVSLENVDMNTQKNIFEKTITDWKGDNEQYDDMLIIGIKL